jgi:hypothetical protein
MYEEIKAGMYDQMSFAFIVDDEEYDSKTHTRTIKRIGKVFDVSAVSFPANPGTDISVATRARFDGFIEEEKAERLAREQEIELARAKYNYIKEKNHGTQKRRNYADCWINAWRGCVFSNQSTISSTSQGILPCSNYQERLCLYLKGEED